MAFSTANLLPVQVAPRGAVDQKKLKGFKGAVRSAWVNLDVVNSRAGKCCADCDSWNVNSCASTPSSLWPAGLLPAAISPAANGSETLTGLVAPQSWVAEQLRPVGGSVAPASPALPPSSGFNELVRRRPGAPLVPATPNNNGNKRKASAELALNIAGNSQLASQADAEFKDLIYSANTLKVKGSLDTLWIKICEARDLAPYPLTACTVTQVAAVLKAANFRSVMAYVYQARQVHIKRGFPWNEELEAAIRDVKRGALRGQGPPNRAAVFAVPLLEHLPASPEVQAGHWPRDRKFAWILATSFLLRETELSTLTISEEEVKLDHVKQNVTLRLSVSKSDPQAKGCSRTLSCCCSKENGGICPFHAAKHLLKEQIHRTGRCQGDPLAWETPLIGRVDNPFEFVGKEAVVAALREDLSMLQSSEYIPTNFDVSLVSGHTFRRSGAQQLALEGVPLDLIQFLARHSGQAIAAYVEDAVERCPTAASKLMEHLSLQEQIAKLVEKVSTVEELQNRTAAALATMASSDSSPSFNEAKARTLVESYLRPGVVLNVGTLKIHSTAGNSFLQSPTDWTTSCGWNWVRAGRLTRVVASADDIPEEATRCAKCRDMFPDWVP